MSTESTGPTATTDLMHQRPVAAAWRRYRANLKAYAIGQITADEFRYARAVYDQTIIHRPRP